MARSWITATMRDGRCRRALAALALLPALPALAQGSGSQIGYSGDGLSCATALVVRGARTASESARAQRDWMARHFPGARPIEKGFTRERGRSYELARIQPQQGAPINLCFDVTEFDAR